MTRFLPTLLASAALCTSLPLQARAELDVVSLKSATLSFRIAPSLKDALEELAKADDRPLSNYVERLLKEHVKSCRGDKAGGTKKAGR